MKHIEPSRILISKFSEENEIDTDAIDALFDELKPIIEKHGFSATNPQIETITLGMEKFSIFKCEACSQLLVNRDLNPAGLDQDYAFDTLSYVVLDGGTHEGKNICEECLPITHRWGHSS